MTTDRGPMVRDELGAVVSALCARFPGRSRSDVERVVAGVYARLVASATVTAHLIPLTLNRSRRLLGSTPKETDVANSEESTAELAVTAQSPLVVDGRTSKTSARGFRGVGTNSSSVADVCPILIRSCGVPR